MVSNLLWDTWASIISILTWLDWIGLTIVLVLVCVLCYLIWRRKFAKDVGKLSMASAMTVPKILELPVDCLSSVWRGFIAGIPWRLRPDALGAPLTLVIGDAGSGKTGVIDRYADWQGQVYLFQPSAIDDPLLQIYAGAKALVLEFGPQLIYDTHPAAFRAIKKLWQHLPPNPQALLVVDANTLLVPQSDSLRKSGLALFGKLKIFGKLENKPLPVILALTHMEKVDGFLEFCQFLQEAGIPLQIEFPDRDGLKHLQTALDRYKQHLNQAMLVRPTQDYLKIVSFLNEAPRVFAVLLDFLRVAGLEQGMASLPVVRLGLFSDQAQSFGSRPFALASGYIKPPLFALNFHAKTALVFLLLGSLYLAGSYNYQQEMVSDVRRGIETVAKTPVEHYSEKISPLFLDFSANLNQDPLLSFLPNFFVKTDQHNKELLIREVRKQYLIPLLKQLQYENDAAFKTTRLLGVLYATPTNEIGKLLSNSQQKHQTDLGKYTRLIDDYIRYNSKTDELDFPLNEITYTKYQDSIEDHTQWLELFRGLQQTVKKPFIEKSELLKIQQQIASFFGVMDRLGYYNDQEEIRQWLNQNTSLRLEITSQSDLRQKGIVQLLDLVSNLKFSSADDCTNNLALNECLAMLQTVANAKPDGPSTDININLNGEHFNFTSGQWAALITRSRVTMMLRNLIDSHKNYDGWVFFGSPSAYPNLELNSSNNGQMLFSGKARIDGRLTVDAFEQKVKPAVLALANLIPGLPVDELEKKRFNEFVAKNLNTYADNYVNAYLNYFRQFRVRIDSAWALDFVLDDLQQPNSQLLQILVQIKNNTALIFPASPSFQAFAQKLTVFRFIQHLMEEKNGVYPEFQKYQLMMAQMQHELDSVEPYTPKKNDGDTAALKGALPPIARVAWAMRLNEDGSYLNVVKSWLQNVGIQDSWQQPFLAPVLKVQDYGTTEINQRVQAIWSDLWDTHVGPLLSKFPFNAGAGKDKEVTVDDLTKTLHPKQGVFWLTFRDYLAALCHVNNGIWIKPYGLSGSLELPANLLDRLNAVQQLSSQLWDGQGNPIPLDLYVKPDLLPGFANSQIPNMPLVSLVYLRSGAVSVLGFNQQADWQKLPLEWWTGLSAGVGMEFVKDAGPIQMQSELNVTDSAWNFFRLLQQGHQNADAQHYQWPLAHPDYPQQALNLKFLFKSNPMSAFANLAGYK